MIIGLAWRSLRTQAVRSLVLGGGFGLGVSVIAILLGIGEVMLEQAGAPALAGGGDVVIAGTVGRVANARSILGTTLDLAPLGDRVMAASPTTRTSLYLVRDGRTVPIAARGGIPSLERALDDDETAGVAAWVDARGDTAWTAPDPGDVLRAMDRFHPIPDIPERADSWAEWLYFNGRAGATRFYLTFLIGPERAPGRRVAGVRLQLEHEGQRESYGETAEVDAARVLADAPDITIGGNRVRLEGERYRITLDLARLADAPGGRASALDGRRAVADIVLVPDAGRSLPPFTIRGARGWTTGYVVPAMSATLDGSIEVGGTTLSLANGSGYHDHNWGHWDGVSWQWGQVAGDGLSFVYGRVHPPEDAADPARMPGFLIALGPDGPVGYSTNVSIEEINAPDSVTPRHITVRARSRALDLTMELEIENAVVTQMDRVAFGNELDFHQLRATYQVRGQVGDQAVDFTAAGAAETFRGREAQVKSDPD